MSMLNKKKGQLGALMLPHTQGLGRGPTIWCIVPSAALPCVFTQEAVSMMDSKQKPLNLRWLETYLNHFYLCF